MCRQRKWSLLFDMVVFREREEIGQTGFWERSNGSLLFRGYPAFRPAESSQQTNPNANVNW